jgi:hypothetical protein
MKRLFVIIGILLVMGAGCSSKKKTAIIPPTKEQVMSQYQQATVEQGKDASYVSVGNGRKVIVTIPSSWVGEGPAWRPSGDSKNSIRVQVFTKDTAEGQWSVQQGEDVHQVLQATKEKDRFLLIVHHFGLKATLVKMFVPDPGNASGYVFAECRIMDEQKDDTSLWNACKTALESIH